MSAADVHLIISYLETRESPYNLKPWFWIVVLAIGPAFAACAYTQFLYLSVRLNDLAFIEKKPSFVCSRSLEYILKASWVSSFSTTPSEYS
jgi:hypothetical protein